MRLLELPAEIQDLIQSDKLTAGHARALLPLGDEAQQLEFARMIIADAWTVRETERRVTLQLENEDDVISTLPPPKLASRKRVLTPQVASLEQQCVYPWAPKSKFVRAHAATVRLLFSSAMPLNSSD